MPMGLRFPPSFQTTHHLFTVRSTGAQSNGQESLDMYFSIFVPRRVATMTKELHHPFLAIATPRGGWLSPNFVITTPPTAFNSSMAVGDLCKIILHWPQGHQSHIKSLQGVLMADQVAIRACDQCKQKDQDSQGIPRSAKALVSSATLHRADFSPKSHASVRLAFNFL